ncbi:MAG: hypothetical protein ACR2JO_03255 [Mycobacteriales bacterium]
MTDDGRGGRLNAMSDEEYDALMGRVHAVIFRATGKRWEDCSPAEREGVLAGLRAALDQERARSADVDEMAAIVRGHGDLSTLSPAAAERFAHLAGVTGFPL